jgi:hypothetical protein
MKKETIAIGGIIVFITMIIGFGANNIPDLFNQASVSSNQIATSTPSTSESVSDSVGQVAWVPPKLVSSLRLVKDATAESQTKYYKVGTVTEGKYKDGDIFLVSVPPDGMGGDSRYKFIKQDGKVIFITKNSDELYDGDYLDRAKFSIDDDAIFSDLILPEKITHKTSTFSLEHPTFNFKPFFSEVFNSSNLVVAFVDPKLGDVYMDIDKEVILGSLVNKKRENGFYVKSKDGILYTYSLDVPFYDKSNRLPAVTWNDGAKNTVEYINTDLGGCGSTNYASVVRGLSVNDLVIVGKTSGEEPIYQLRDTNSSILQNIYKNDYNPYQTPKISYEEFIQSKPTFFWFDVFGRLIKFQKADFVPAVECGKPVIYLYPEQTTDVSVQVAPQGGFTKTEPDYGTGWNVRAEPNGRLTELKTGTVYPYLFWEGRGGLYTTPTKGFVVKAEDVHDFLVEKLTKLGLNQQEQNDFMEFWEPKMTGAPYFFVTFLGKKEMDALAPLTVTPKPDSVIRILMDFSPLQKPISVEGYDIKTPARNGFTVVEWGGVIR